jgi:hypothetical protein
MNLKLYLLIISLVIFEYINAQSLKKFENNKNKFGVKNSNNEIIIPAKYDRIEITENDRIIVNTGFKETKSGYKLGKWGVLNEKGEVVIPVKLDFIYGEFEHFVFVKNATITSSGSINGKFGLLDNEGKVILEPIYDLISTDNSYIFMFNIGGKLNGKHFEGGKFGIYNPISKSKSSADYDFINDFENGVAWFEKNKKYGLISIDGFVIYPEKWDNVYSFQEGIAKIVLDEKVGYINEYGEVIIEPKYKDGKSFSETLIAVKHHDKWGYINENDSVVIPFLYDHACDFINGVTHVEKNGLEGVIDYNNNLLIDFKYKDLRCYNEYVMSAKLNNKYGFINIQEEWIIPEKYDFAWDFEDEIAKVCIGCEISNGIVEGGKYGFIDYNDEEIIEIKYDFIGPFVNGKAYAEINGKSFFVNKSGSIFNEKSKTEE